MREREREREREKERGGGECDERMRIVKEWKKRKK